MICLLIKLFGFRYSIISAANIYYNFDFTKNVPEIAMIHCFMVTKKCIFASDLSLQIHYGDSFQQTFWRTQPIHS